MTDEIEDTPPPQTDWYIKVDDRAALITALKGPSESRDTFDDEGNVTGSETVYPHGIITQDDDDNDVIMATNWVRVDDIGSIYEATGKTLTDDEGNEYPEMAAVPGYHANLRKLSDKADTLIQHLEDGGHIITPPATPARGFA
tara:strand:+ start:950 stop:1378 length:429 start_codon:yes stop_codon:yes gene_type:complete